MNSKESLTPKSDAHISTYDYISAFCTAIQATGLEPPAVIEPDKWHRFPGIGKKGSNRAGWCRLFVDGTGGVFGDFSSGLSKAWQAERIRPYTPSERAYFKRNADESRAEAKAIRATEHAEAATRAMTIWNVAMAPSDDHPYLTRKHINAHSARLLNDSLVLPITDFTGTLTSLQFIAPDGGKTLLKGGRKQGSYIHVAGNAHAPDRVWICEGWATGCTLAENDPTALVIAAIDAGNLKSVALSARYRWPYAQLIIAGDDDRLKTVNTGAIAAHAAAVTAGALLALPDWPDGAPDNLSDANDLAAWLAEKPSLGEET